MINIIQALPALIEQFKKILPINLPENLNEMVKKL